MENNQELTKLIKYIEENLRASRSSGLKFIDPRNFRERLVSKQNHIIYGRRGAGKSTLVRSLDGLENVVAIQINLEDFKDITFPNIIIRVLAETLRCLEKQMAKRYPIYRLTFRSYGFKRSLKATVKQLEELLYEPDFEEKQVKTSQVQEHTSKAAAGAEFAVVPSHFGFKVSGQAKKLTKEEVSRSIPVDKLERLRTDLPKFKRMFLNASEMLDSSPIFLVLDDFYFITKSTQPDFIDYFHRIAKDTELYLKIATIKHRSRVYKQTGESFVGVESGHDVYEIDMDYTLDKFSDLQRFMRELLDGAREASNAHIDIDSLFSGDGFTQLCLASGGVPRDLLALFVKLASDIVGGSRTTIGKLAVTEAAISNRSNKLTSMKTDSAEEKEILEKYLLLISDRVYTQKRTNAFLVAKPELENWPQERQAIRELVDLRLLHLVDSNTSSAPSDGRRYEAYILDLCLYDNPRPRNFNQIEPGAQDEKSRRDKLRAAPRLPLPELKSNLERSGEKRRLLISDN